MNLVQQRTAHIFIQDLNDEIKDSTHARCYTLFASFIF